MKGSKPTEEQIARGKELKEQLAELEAKLEVEDKEFRDLLKTVPNIIFEDVPLGDESASVEVKLGEVKKPKVLIISTMPSLVTGSISNVVPK